jgi:proteic killer suppression protein
LHISFQSRHLRSICESESYANAALGVALSAKLIARLFDISAAGNVWELPVGRPESRFQEGEEYIILTLDSDVRIGFVCGHKDPPKNADDSTNWEIVSRIKLMFIGDEK